MNDQICSTVINARLYDTMLLPALKNEITRLHDAVDLALYNTEYASLLLPDDYELQEKVCKLAQEKKALDPDCMVVIGIGGSNLGTIAVQEALYGTLYNEISNGIKVYYADTVDPDYIAEISKLVSKARFPLVVVVSKSGNTIETVANAQIIISLLADNKKNSADHLVIITDSGSSLWNIARDNNYACLPIAPLVGGRYSVLSAVGLFPLAMLGIDIKKLHAGARAMRARCIDQQDNPAAVRATIIVNAYRAGLINHNTFVFSKGLKGVAEWYRQLVAESLGKKNDRQGRVVEVGIMPLTSVGSVDLHSVAQLYLGGPRNVLTTFVTTKKFKHEQIIPVIEEFNDLASSLVGKTTNQIMSAIAQGTMRAYQKDVRPFMEIELPSIDEYALGQLLQLYMCEVMYAGFLLDINPFDQPAVEFYKSETRKVLAND